jgi:uncharacterized protein YukE
LADVDVTYEQVQSVSGALNNAYNEIVPQLTTLKSQVDGMLTQGGGMWMNSTSPVLQESYQNFNAGLNQAIQGITQFASQFDQIANQVYSMDAQFANSIGGAANKAPSTTPPPGTVNIPANPPLGPAPFPGQPGISTTPPPASGS